MTIALTFVVMAAGGALSFLLGNYMSSIRMAFVAYGLFIVGVAAAVVAGVLA